MLSQANFEKMQTAEGAGETSHKLKKVILSVSWEDLQQQTP